MRQCVSTIIFCKESTFKHCEENVMQMCSHYPPFRYRQQTIGTGVSSRQLHVLDGQPENRLLAETGVVQLAGNPG